MLLDEQWQSCGFNQKYRRKFLRELRSWLYQLYFQLRQAPISAM